MGVRVRGVSGGGLAVLVVLSLLAIACGRTGEATIRLGQAEDEVVEVVDALVEAMQLDVTQRQELGTPGRCELVTGQTGGSNATAVRAPIPDVDDLLGRASAVLVQAGFELVDGELDDGVFGRRAGMRVTVVAEESTGRVMIDAHTGCRPT